jgi:GAF domain-containing protein/HAMP domain-containing protein
VTSKFSRSQPVYLTNLDGRAWSAFLAVLILLGSTVALNLFFVALALRYRTWQGISLAWVIGVYVLALVAAALAIRRGQIALGLGLTIGGALLVFPVISALVDGVGSALSLSLVFLVMTVAAQALSRKQINWVLIVTVVAGLVTLMLDIFGSWFFRATSRLTFPEYRILIVVMSVVAVLVCGYFIARQFVNYTLHTKLILAFLIVALIPLSLLAFLNERTARVRLTAEANRSLLAAASQTAANLDSFVSSNLDIVGVEAQLPALAEYLRLPSQARPGSEAERRALEVLQILARREEPYITSYALLDSNGVDVLDTHSMDVWMDKSDRGYFGVPRDEGRAYVSPVEYSSSTGLPAIYFSSPVYDEGGSFLGVVRVRYNAAVLQQLIAASNDLAGENSFAALFDEFHIPLAHGIAPGTRFKPIVPLEPEMIETLQRAKRLPEVRRSDFFLELPELEYHLNAASSDPFFKATDVATGSKLNQVALARTNTQPWLVAFFQPQEVYLSAIQSQGRTTLLFALLIAGLVAGAALGMGQLLASPIVRLNEIASRVAAGDLKARAVPESSDEIGRLATTFNEVTSRLRATFDTLEERVHDRTRRLAIAVEISRRLSAILDLASLMREVVTITKETFNYYHVHIYLLDDHHEALIMAEGYGEAGWEMKRQGHSIQLTAERSLVARAAREGRAIVVEDVENDPKWLSNPLLPDTRAEMAIPIKLDQEVAGVLDVQSEKVGGITAEDEAVLQILANQIAVAVRNARLFTETQEALYRAQKLQNLYTSEAWRTLASNRAGTDYEFQLASRAVVGQADAPEAESALHTMETVTWAGGGSSVQTSGPTSSRAAGWIDQNSPEPEARVSQRAVATPLSLHGQILGVLGIQDANSDRQWTEDEIALIEAVSEQMSLAIENARLFEETGRRAEREKIIANITRQIWASSEMDEVMRTAVEQLGTALNAARVVIQLGTEEQLAPHLPDPNDATAD